MIANRTSSMAVPLLSPQPQRGRMMFNENSAVLFYRNAGWDLSDLNGVDGSGWTKLALAVRAGRIDVVKDLVNRGANPLSLSKERQNLLHVAVRAGQHHVVVYLLDHSAGKQLATMRCYGGFTPLMLACTASSPIATAEALVPHSKLNTTDFLGCTASDHAAQAQRDDLVTLFDLVAYRAKVREVRTLVKSPGFMASMIEGTLWQLARDLPHWRDRANAQHLDDMSQALAAIVHAHPHVCPAEAGQVLEHLQAVHSMKALRIKMLQERPVLPTIRLSVDGSGRSPYVSMNERIREQQDRVFHAATLRPDRNRLNAEKNRRLLAFDATLLGVQILLVSIQREIESDALVLQDAELRLQQAIAHADGAIAQMAGAHP